LISLGRSSVEELWSLVCAVIVGFALGHLTGIARAEMLHASGSTFKVLSKTYVCQEKK